VRIRQRNHLLEPITGDDDIIIEQRELFSACQWEPLIGRREKPAVCRVRDDRSRDACGILQARQVTTGAIGRAVLDDGKTRTGSLSADGSD
jgi:hypothetical protein